MDTSDDSFAWTDASSDSSKDKVVEMKPNKSKQGSDKYEAHKDESHSELETIQVEKKHKDKKRKKQDIHEEIESDNINDQTNRSIKSEPNSDFDVSKKRHKCNETRTSSNYDESFGEAEDYLNLRVKQEQATFVEPTAKKAKKKKKDKGASKTSEEQELDDIEKYNLDSSCLLNGENSDMNDKDISYRKKKKKKKKLSIDTSEILEDSEDSHKTKKKKKYKDLLQNDDSDGNNFQHEIENNSQIISSTLLYNSIKENVKEEFNNDIQNFVSVGNSTSTSQKSGKTEGPFIKKACRISDRLRFEEDSVDYEPREDALKNDISIQLEQFISYNINLRSLQADFHNDPGISDDDEVWILKGPHDISVEDLENAKLTLDGKKKVKINGNTYDTTIDSTICAAPILLFKKKNIFIKNKSLKGAINLRKRIPKIHIPYESLMENNKSSFIPLPETKCRHPLFGIHYEKATKVAPEIAERLDSSIVVPNAVSKMKKKHKEKREIESDIEVKPNIEVLHSSKKKRQIAQKLENESDIEVKPNIAEPHSNKKKRKMKETLEIEPDIEVKPIIEALHSNKKKRKMKENLRVESDSEMKSSIEGSHSKKKKRKNKDRLGTESDTDVKPSIEKLSIEVSESNKKKRKHSDDPGKKAKRVKSDPSSAEAWESERAIEKNLFDF